MSEGNFTLKYIDAFSAQSGIVLHIKREFNASTAYVVVGGQGKEIVILDDFLVAGRLEEGDDKFIAWLSELQGKLPTLPQVHNPRFYEGFAYFLKAYDAILFENRGFIGYHNLVTRLRSDFSPAAITKFCADLRLLMEEIEHTRPKDNRTAMVEPETGQTPVTAPFAQSVNPIELRDLIIKGLGDDAMLHNALLLLAQDLAGAIKMDVRNNPQYYKDATGPEIIARAMGVAAEAFKLFHDFAIVKNKPFAGTRGYFTKILSLQPTDQLIFLVDIFDQVLKLGQVPSDQHLPNIQYLQRVIAEA
jgi:hypothetical protein